MIRYRLTPAAQLDLEQIWDYTNESWGPEQAEGYLRELQTGYRKLASGSHVLFYRVDDVLDIIRVLHGRMDVDRNL